MTLKKRLVKGADTNKKTSSKQKVRPRLWQGSAQCSREIDL